MNIQLYKIIALCKKDIKDLRRNSSVVLMACLSLFFTVLYRFMNLGGEQLPAEFVLSIGVLMNISMLPIAVMSMIIAEEKEKFTLRTLMLSNVSAMDFLVSKAIVIFVLSQSVSVISYMVVGSIFPFGTFFGITALTCVCMLLFGAIVGIISKNQMSTGVASTPLTMIMLIPAIFGQADEEIAKIAQFIPTYAMLELFKGTDRSVFYLLVIACWIIIAAVLFTVVYQKKRLDA